LQLEEIVETELEGVVAVDSQTHSNQEPLEVELSIIGSTLFMQCQNSLEKKANRYARHGRYSLTAWQISASIPVLLKATPASRPFGDPRSMHNGET
jgi:hypothetical protein